MTHFCEEVIHSVLVPSAAAEAANNLKKNNTTCTIPIKIRSFAKKMDNTGEKSLFDEFMQKCKIIFCRTGMGKQQ